MDRKGRNNSQRFPQIKREGKYYCRFCKKLLTGRLSSFCGRRCLRDFKMVTDWLRVRKVVFYRDGGVCMKCGLQLTIKKFHIDHIIPISKGGAEWDLNNLELSCQTCNLRKGNK